MELLKNYIRRNNHIFYWYWFLRYSIQILKAKRIIIVTAPGHSGTSSLYSSIKAHSQKFKAMIYDIHSIREKYNNDSLIPSTSARHILQEVLDLFRRFKFFGKEVMLVSIIREPVARTIGAFFHSKQIRIRNDKKALPIQERVKFYHDYIFRSNAMGNNFLDSMVKWQINFFDIELGGLWGIDFNDVKNYEGYQKIHGRWCNLYLFKLKDIEKGLISFGEDMINKKIEVVTKNTFKSRMKDSNLELLVYDQLKNRIKLTKNELDRIYRYRIFKIVYDHEEIKQFKQKYLRGSSIE